MYRALLPVALAALLPACTTLKSEMRQAEASYEQSNYEDAIVWFEALEPDEPRMGVDQRARYHYLRGMASYRLGKSDDALYYLSLAREIVAHEGAKLDSTAVSEMNTIIDDLTPQSASHRARGASSGGEVAAP